MTLPVNDPLVAAIASKPGGEGGTPGMQSVEIDAVEVDTVEVEEVSRPGGEGGTPGV